MRGNVFFHLLGFYPLRLPGFITTTGMAFSVVEEYRCASHRYSM
jgi:hypothetical protein